MSSAHAGIHLEGSAGSAHVAIAPSDGLAPYPCGSKVAGSRGTAGVASAPGPDTGRSEGVAGERVPSRMRRIGKRSGELPNTELLPPLLASFNREVVNAESTTRLCGARGCWGQ